MLEKGCGSQPQYPIVIYVAAAAQCDIVAVTMQGEFCSTALGSIL